MYTLKDDDLHFRKLISSPPCFKSLIVNIRAYTHTDIRARTYIHTQTRARTYVIIINKILERDRSVFTYILMFVLESVINIHTIEQFGGHEAYRST